MTYVLIPTRDENSKYTFQVAIATDQYQTFALINYREVGKELGIVGVSDRLCRRLDLRVAGREELLKGGYHGQHVIRLTPYKGCGMKCWYLI